MAFPGQVDFLPALRFRSLNRLYDSVATLAVRDLAHKRSLVVQANIRPGERVLDVGCGTGTLSILISEFQPQSEITGLDADPGMLAIARRKASRRDARVQFVCALAQQSLFPSSYFDCVVSSLFFHHLHRDAKLATMKEVHRILIPGGRLHIVDWGRPANILMRSAFLCVRMLDGFVPTEDNAQGNLPNLLGQSGFDSLQRRGRMNTLFGTLEFLSAVKSGDAQIGGRPSSAAFERARGDARPPVNETQNSG
ncbi:MAG: class I SAM-dependent methyltransferase [Gammaproteobacteria bacterium]|nr:class I SAM-dependent methyltransferase [Gammaproteobacteria bacterium]